jgi:hypothetical protein
MVQGKNSFEVSSRKDSDHSVAFETFIESPKEIKKIKKNAKNGFWIILILLILALGVSGYYWFLK